MAGRDFQPRFLAQLLQQIVTAGNVLKNIVWPVYAVSGIFGSEG